MFIYNYALFMSFSPCYAIQSFDDKNDVWSVPREYTQTSGFIRCVFTKFIRCVFTTTQDMLYNIFLIGFSLVYLIPHPIHFTDILISSSLIFPGNSILFMQWCINNEKDTPLFYTYWDIWTIPHIHIISLASYIMENT